jgi:hypothetical protein
MPISRFRGSRTLDLRHTLSLSALGGIRTHRVLSPFESMSGSDERLWI